MSPGQHGKRAASVFAAFLAAFGLAACASTQHAPPPEHWVASWGTSQIVAERDNVLEAEKWRNASLRQLVHVSLGGSRIRLRLSNVFGTAPLTVEAASIARALVVGKADVDAASIRALAFNGKASVTIPPGGEYYSDAVDFPHAAGADLAISLHFKDEPARQTSHPGSRTTSFLAKGNRVAEAAWPGAETFTRWYVIADLEVLAPRTTGAVVAIGDSITDGNGATTDGNDRWPDLLARRLRAEGPAMGVVNAGIGGGRMLKDGIGPNLVSRFDRDVLARSGVTHAIVLIGVNDLGVLHRNAEDTPQARAQLVDNLKMAYRQIVAKAHAHGICVVGATITPYAASEYYHPKAPNEADRQELNAFIRSSGTFDAVADFDAAIRDPAQPDRMAKDKDKGDGLHPGTGGFRAMADAVPLAALAKTCK
jgi:lysophospholipase L1-like esterase